MAVKFTDPKVNYKCFQCDMGLSMKEKNYKISLNPFYMDDEITLDRIYARRKYLHYTIGGGTNEIRRHFFNFKSPTPKIELCEIIDFCTKLRDQRCQLDSVVYIDLCTESKFYVGYTSIYWLKKGIEPTDKNMAMCRLESHRDNGGGVFYTIFTTIFPVISCLTYFYGDKEDEDLMTLLMNHAVGNNVRGGQWASARYIPDYPEMSIDEIKSKLLSRHIKNIV
jgi:hypothetical protein